MHKAVFSPRHGIDKRFLLSFTLYTVFAKSENFTKKLFEQNDFYSRANLNLNKPPNYEVLACGDHKVLSIWYLVESI